MSGPLSPKRDWIRPEWVDDLLLKRRDALDKSDFIKKTQQYERMSACLTWKRCNIDNLLALKRVAEVQAHWLNIELDRLRKEKDMLVAGTDPYTSEEMVGLRIEQEDKFVEDFVEPYSSISEEEMEALDDRTRARKEIREYGRLIEEEKKEILKVELEIVEIKIRREC